MCKYSGHATVHNYVHSDTRIIVLACTVPVCYNAWLFLDSHEVTTPVLVSLIVGTL